MPSHRAILQRLRRLGDSDIAAHSMRFFKTGPGDYGEGDRFLGIRMPVIRGLVKEFRGTDTNSILSTLHSPFHEARILAVLMMTDRYRRSRSETEQEEIYRQYLANTRYINNWDLVDCSAEHIPGAYLYTRSRKPLYKLAGSAWLWDRRIAIMATLHFIKRRDFKETLAIAKKLMTDREDLIHKASGWMLREVGNRDRSAEKVFLDQYAATMPRTMLRYAIEKFPEPERQAYLKRTT